MVRSANQGELKGKKVCAGVFWREAYLESIVQPKNYFRVIPLRFLFHFIIIVFFYFMCLAIGPVDSPAALTGETGKGICKYT